MALDLAYNHSSNLNKTYSKSIIDERFLFWSPKPWIHYNLPIDNDNWNRTEYVSIDGKNNVKAFFKADWDRGNNKISSITVMIFDEKSNIAKRDLYTFLHKLYSDKLIRKIEWTVVVGNPVEKMYDKIITKYGGRIVGTYKKAWLLRDGEYYDKKCYEIIKDNG